MAIFLGVSAAPERILLSKISYAPVQHSSLHQKVLLCFLMVAFSTVVLCCVLCQCGILKVDGYSRPLALTIYLSFVHKTIVVKFSAEMWD